MKNLKDYLHFHLECPCLVSGRSGYVQIVGAGEALIAFDDVRAKESDEKWVCTKDIKLVLRPFSDITKAEMIEICKIEGLVVAKISKSNNELIKAVDDSYTLTIRYKSRLIELEKNGALFQMAKSFEITHYLLKKGFDIFGLIDADLAIATKKK